MHDSEYVLDGPCLNIGIGWLSILGANSVKETLNAPKENKLMAYRYVGHIDKFLDKPELEALN
ncbi:MAG: hypothetical protein JKX81_11825 [Arenicella sp.]|nr:hypothetical protein [Arenicella sp.]